MQSIPFDLINDSEKYITLRIMQKSDEVSLNKLGVLNTMQHTYIPQSLVDKYHRYLVQYMLSTERYHLEEALCIRDLDPLHDFCDRNGNYIDTSKWKQEYENNTFSYKIERNSKNDMKSYLVYGVEYLDKERPHATTLELWWPGVKLMYRWCLSQRYNSKFNLFNRPILTRLNDMLEFRFGCYDKGDNVDRIRLLGWVIEPLGMSVMG